APSASTPPATSCASKTPDGEPVAHAQVAQILGHGRQPSIRAERGGIAAETLDAHDINPNSGLGERHLAVLAKRFDALKAAAGSNGKTITDLAEALGARRTAVETFFRIRRQVHLPPEPWLATLTEIAERDGRRSRNLELYLLPLPRLFGRVADDRGARENAILRNELSGSGFVVGQAVGRGYPVL
ncbi:MAG: hypothetical protein ACOC3D_13660, partial [Pseudomonadota bacterium]